MKLVRGLAGVVLDFAGVAIDLYHRATGWDEEKQRREFMARYARDWWDDGTLGGS